MRPKSRSLRIGSRPFHSARREAQPALPVGDAEQAVLAPAVGAAARLIVGEVLPHVAVRRVVLSDRAPLALGQVRPPALPVPLATRVLRETLGFRSGHEVPPDARYGSRLDPLKLGLAAGYNATCPERVPFPWPRPVIPRCARDDRAPLLMPAASSRSLTLASEVPRQADPPEAAPDLPDQADLEAVSAGAAQAVLDVPLDHAHVARGELAIDVIVQPPEDRLARRLVSLSLTLPAFSPAGDLPGR